MKAAFLVNFASFVEWPDRTFASREAPIVLCVDGDNPLGDALDAILEGRSAGGRPLEARRLAPAQTPAGCHVLFVGASEEKLTDAIVAYARRSAILTVGDFADFAARGGTVEFFVDGRRIRFIVNVGSAARADLKISARLLALARVIDPPEDGTR